MTHSRIIGHPIASNKEVDVIGTQKSKKKQRKLYNKSVCFFLFFFLNFILATCFVCLHWTNVHTMETSLSRHITITSSGREKKKDWKLVSIGWQQHRKEDDALMIEDVISFYKRKKKWLLESSENISFTFQWTSDYENMLCWPAYIRFGSRQLTMRIDSNFCVLSLIQIF